MTTRALFNQLELAFAPVCNYDFTYFRSDEGFRRQVQSSTLYLITQRPELTFEEVVPTAIDGGQVILHFIIRQKGHDSILNCQLPLYQNAYARDINKEIQLHFQYALPKPDPMPKAFPQNGVRNLLLYYDNGPFIGWISPESFIQNCLNEAIEANIVGPIDDFLSYKVHYVGKATEQAVWKRLTGHSTLQDILSQEYPIHYGTLPTHEIAVLFLKVQEPMGFLTIGPDDPIPSNISDFMNGANLPSNRVLSLDAEKALIQAMKPAYNKVYYDNYPHDKEGLSALSLDSYSYQIWSNLRLKYEGGNICGRPDLFADALLVRKGEPLQVIHQGDALADFRLRVRQRFGGG
jgi:hypothetical protein